MSRDAGQAFVRNFLLNALSHYADQYYDPQKAHEYYLQNRELKGRQSSSGLTVKNGKKVNKAATQRKQEAWSYTKKQIDNAHKVDDKAAQQAHHDVVKQMQETARARRDELSKQLSDALKAISQQHSGDVQQISDSGKAELKTFAVAQAAKGKKISEDAANEIANLPVIPKGISTKARAKLIAERADKIAKIRQTAVDGLSKIAEDTRTGSADIAAGTVAKRTASSADVQKQKQGAQNGANASREVVTAQLKTAVEKARIDYLTRKESLSAQYEATAQQEYDAIKARV